MTLTDYITDNFGQVKSQLGWSDSDTLPTIIDKALELYGVTTEAAATDLTKLHAVADIAVWRQALNDVSLDIDFSADNASFRRSQMAETIRKNLAEAQNAALIYAPAYQINVHPDDTNSDWEL